MNAKKIILLILIGLRFNLAAQTPSANQGAIELATYIGTDTYIFGLPLVLNYQFRNKMMGISKVSQLKDSKIKLGNIENGLNFNQWIHVETFATHEIISGASPNNDTNYSVCFADLSKEPIVLKVPKINDRYFNITVSDAYLENVANIGTRNHNTNGGNFALVGPNYKGSLPKNIKAIKMPQDYFCFIVRIQCRDASADFQKVIKLQRKFEIESLSKFTGKIKNDIKIPLTPAPKITNGLDYFSNLLKYMQACPPAKKDSGILKKMALIGLKIDGSTDVNKLSEETKTGLQNAYEKSQKLIDWAIVSTNQNTKNNWFFTYERGKPATYLQRAHYSQEGMYTNDKEEALYPQTVLDENGLALDGKNNYTFTIPKDKVAPVEAFWSLTTYVGSELVPNPYFHYAIGDGKTLPVERNTNGSITVYIQNEMPENKMGNWIPTPKEGPFRIIYRMYLPKSKMFNSDMLESYLPPVILKNKP